MNFFRSSWGWALIGNGNNSCGTENVPQDFFCLKPGKRGHEISIGGDEL